MIDGRPTRFPVSCGCGWSSDQPNPDSARFAEVCHRQACMGPGRRARLADLHVRLDRQLGELVDAVDAREWETAGDLARQAQETGCRVGRSEGGGGVTGGGDVIASARAVAEAGRREADRFRADGRPDDARFVLQCARWWDKQADREAATRLEYLRGLSAQVGRVRARLAAAVASIEDREFPEAIHEIANAAEVFGELVESRRQWKERAESEVCRGEPDLPSFEPLPPDAGFIEIVAQAVGCDSEDIRRMHR